MQVGDLVRWVDKHLISPELCPEYGYTDEIAGMIIQMGEHNEVEVWFLNGYKSEWCFSYDLEVVCK